MIRIKKEKVLLLILFLILVLPCKVVAYEIQEIIPVGEEATIDTDSFLYTAFYYNKKTTTNVHYIVFKSIKNQTKKQIPISISIALFDKDQKNIGTVNYCSKKESSNPAKSEVLLGGEERSYSIKVTNDYLQEGKTIEDVEYISLLSENKKCKTSGSTKNIGKTAEQLNKHKKTKLDRENASFFKVTSIIIIILLGILAYKIYSVRKLGK